MFQMINISVHLVIDQVRHSTRFAQLYYVIFYDLIYRLSILGCEKFSEKKNENVSLITPGNKG